MPGTALQMPGTAIQLPGSLILHGWSYWSYTADFTDLTLLILLILHSWSYWSYTADLTDHTQLILLILHSWSYWSYAADLIDLTQLILLILYSWSYWSNTADLSDLTQLSPLALAKSGAYYVISVSVYHSVSQSVIYSHPYNSQSFQPRSTNLEFHAQSAWKHPKIGQEITYTRLGKAVIP